MPVKPQLIARYPREPGAAQSHVDLKRRIKSLETRAGVVGQGATITGASIQTADSGARIYMQGPLGTNPGGEGFFCDNGAVISVAIKPTTGIEIDQNSWISWVVSGSEVAQITFLSPSYLGSPAYSINLALGSPNGLNSTVLSVAATDIASECQVEASTGTHWATVLDGVGNGTWERSIGFWNTFPPNSQPGVPTTLAQVITILQAYGFCSS